MLHECVLGDKLRLVKCSNLFPSKIWRSLNSVLQNISDKSDTWCSWQVNQVVGKNRSLCDGRSKISRTVKHFLLQSLFDSFILEKVLSSKCLITWMCLILIYIYFQQIQDMVRKRLADITRHVMQGSFWKRLWQFFVYIWRQLQFII